MPCGSEFHFPIKSCTFSIFFLPDLAYDLDMDDVPLNRQLLNKQSEEASAIHNSGKGRMTDLNLLASVLLASTLLLTN